MKYVSVIILSFAMASITMAQEAIGVEDLFVVVEEMPQFPGGEEAMNRYLGQHVKYPVGAWTNGIQGTVQVSFIVEIDGSISNVRIMESIGGGCDEEVLRLLKGMPAWVPGRQKGKNVRVQYSIPVKFALNEKTGKQKETKK